jgi:yjeF C-terminal region, hydroxyethylthiazole kinase-related/yjeF N-terminal region
MIKIFNVDEVAVLDNFTIENEPISSIDLVERAAMAFANEYERCYSKQKRVTVFAGPGNNGADALAVARLLIEEFYSVKIFLFSPKGEVSPDCEINKNRLKELEADIKEVSSAFDPPKLTSEDVVIDGLFGTGLNRPLEGGFAGVVKYINKSEATVVSIDIPSGLFGEDNRENKYDSVIKADYTITFGFPKLAFMLAENSQYVGDWKVLDIGIHPDIVEKTETLYTLITEDDVYGIMSSRDKFAHKGNFGHAFLIAGSRGKMGAAQLAAQACLRSGAGLLTAHIPQCGEIIMQTSFPEAMVSIDDNVEHLSVVPDITPYSAIAVGPGMGQHEDSKAALEDVLLSTTKRLVIDADAINIIAANRDLISVIPACSILTPHPKEFDRLVGESATAYERMTKAKAFAQENNVIIVLKGAHTSVFLPNGQVFFNSSGNPGMATAGSGDVLTGVLLGLLAQGCVPELAAIAGVYIHGAAGDLAAASNSEESMIASDIIGMLGKIFKQIR